MTITEIKQQLKKLAAEKGRPDYDLCVVRDVKHAIDNNLNHPLLSELDFTKNKPIEVCLSAPKKRGEIPDSRKRPEKSQEIDLVNWLNRCGMPLYEIAAEAGLSGSIISLIKARRRKVTLYTYKRIIAAREALSGVAV